MFVQVIQGDVTDPAAVRQRWSRWGETLKAGATGWLGATAGITAAGEFVAVVRFESEEAAQANSDRPEQGEWWEDMVGLFSGPVTFRNTNDVQTVAAGGSDDAGFVQLMGAHVADRGRLEELERQFEPSMTELRPDFVGGLRLWFEGGELLVVDYFTSEEEARAGEAKEMAPELKADFEEWFSLSDQKRWYDLPDPWLESP